MEFYLYLALFSPFVGSLFAATMGASPKNLIAGIVPSFITFYFICSK
jgi:NADH-quinone oxidoreductase subunit L